MRISKQLRSQAADLCAVAASYGRARAISVVASEMFGISQTRAQEATAAWIAVRAWSEASNKHVRSGRSIVDDAAIRDDYAEAEAMLRNGEWP